MIIVCVILMLPYDYSMRHFDAISYDMIGVF